MTLILNSLQMYAYRKNFIHLSTVQFYTHVHCGKNRQVEA